MRSLSVRQGPLNTRLEAGVGVGVGVGGCVRACVRACACVRSHAGSVLDFFGRQTQQLKSSCTLNVAALKDLILLAKRHRPVALY